MKKAIGVAALSACLSFAAGIAVADKVHDWHDLEEVHNHVQESIHEMENARAANHYDMAGHGARAEEDLRKAEHELHDAIEAARGGVSRLTVTHDVTGAPKLAALTAGERESGGAGGGWNEILSGLKTLLETGVPLPFQSGPQ